MPPDLHRIFRHEAARDTLLSHMSTSIRDLRNQFPKVRKLVETLGEVILTEKGKPRYRLTLYTPQNPAGPAPVDYWARLNSYQPRSMTKAQARALYDENRGER